MAALVVIRASWRVEGGKDGFGVDEAGREEREREWGWDGKLLRVTPPLP